MQRKKNLKQYALKNLKELWKIEIENALHNQSCLREKWDLISGPHVKISCIQNKVYIFHILYFLVSIIIDSRNTSIPLIITTTEM